MFAGGLRNGDPQRKRFPKMPAALLTDRTVIAVRGEDAQHFLQNLITTDIDVLAEGEAAPGALLTPQGKILFDFLISRGGGGYRLDCRRDLAGDLIKRLTLYKLRAKVEFSESDQGDTTVSWNTDSTSSGGLKDLRFISIPVFRHYGPDAPAADSTAAEWHAFRIANGVGESGGDYQLGDAFPHDILLDRNGGVSFRKGCFVGQEVVSRMQHRGTARRRLLIAGSPGALPEPGTEIAADGRVIGTLGSVAGSMGLALVRIDRAANAMHEGTAIMAGETELELRIPDWAGFEFPSPGVQADGD
jgi:folate-binding protein YgfZ